MSAVVRTKSTSSTTGTRSNTRWAKTVPTSVGQRPRLRPSSRRLRTATRASSPTRPGTTDVREQPDAEGREHEPEARERRRHRRADHGVPGEGARDDREQVEADRDGDPVPLDRREGVLEVGPVRPVPPEQRADAGEEGEHDPAAAPRGPTESCRSLFTRRRPRRSARAARRSCPTSSARPPASARCSPSDRRRGSSSSSATSASASARSSPGGKSTPVSSVMTALYPGMSDATTGTAHAKPRVSTMPKLSWPTDGTASAFARSSSAVSFSCGRKPRMSMPSLGIRCRASRSCTASGSAPTSRSRAPVRRWMSGHAFSSTGIPLRRSWRPMNTIVSSRLAGSAAGGISTPFGITSKSQPFTHAWAEARASWRRRSAGRSGRAGTPSSARPRASSRARRPRARWRRSGSGRRRAPTRRSPASSARAGGGRRSAPRRRRA